MKLKRGIKILAWVAGVGLVAFALTAVFWVRHFHAYTPREALKDVRAGIAARHDPKPVEKFLELRYGSMTEPANREKAFLDFFNPGHIEGMHLLVKHMPPEKKPVHIAAMAQWIANYRTTMTPQEKASLQSILGTDAGRQTLKQATSQYLSHEASYRAATTKVIGELIATLAEIQKPATP